MKKILFVTNSIWNIDNFRKPLILNFLEKQNLVYIIAPNEKNYRLKIKHKNLKVININFSQNSYFNFKDFIFFFKLVNFLKNYKPHYVLSFTIKPNLICAFLSKFLKFKSICNITGLGTLFLRGKIIKIIAIYLYKFSIRNAFFIFFHNNDDKNLFIKKNIIDKKKCDLIPGSGVNLDYFSYYEKKYSKNHSLNFLYLGRIIRDKGIIEYLNAISEIKKINYNVTFTFVGKLNYKDKKLLKLFNYCLSNNYIEYLNEATDVKKYIIDCDCLVLPSYREGLSKSLLEASAIGRPMLVSNVPGCRDVVQNNFNGLLFNAKDYKSLQSCLIKFIEMPTIQKNLLAKNANKLSSKFDEMIIVKKYFNKIK